MTYEKMWNILKHELQACVDDAKHSAENGGEGLRKDWKPVVSTLQYVVDSMNVMEGESRRANKAERELGSVKDLLHDLRTDVSAIQSFEEFEKDKPFLLGWINGIELLLGLKEEGE